MDMVSLFSLQKLGPSIKNAQNAVSLNLPAVKAGEPLIMFDNVSFGYKNGGKPILREISFTVRKGQKIGVVGSSGCGKSTILRLLFRFYDPISGSISIADHDIRSVKLESLRANIGIVPQDSSLFNDTIYYNIAYGNPKASREQVEKATEHAQLLSLIQSMPEKFNTQVGERGLKLSGILNICYLVIVLILFEVVKSKGWQLRECFSKTPTFSYLTNQLQPWTLRQSIE
jgi:ABC transporter ATM